MTNASSTALVHAAGAPPKRSTDSVVASFGLVSIPLAVYKGLEDAEAPVVRHNFSKTTGNPVGTKQYDKVTGLDVTNEDVVKKATASDGETTVELTTEEIADICAGSKGEAAIEKFIPLTSLIDGTYVIEGFKQARAKKLEVNRKKLPNKGGDQALATLLAGMEAEGVAALMKVSFGTAPRYAALMPDGHLAMLAFSHQVKESLPLPEYMPAQAEMDMARMLIHTIGVDTPLLVDEAGPALQAFVDAKAAGGPVAAVKPVVAAAPQTDLMAAMAASLGLPMPAAEEPVEEVEADPALTPEQNPPDLIDEPVDEPEASAPVVKVASAVTLGAIYEQARALRVAS